MTDLRQVVAPTVVYRGSGDDPDGHGLAASALGVEVQVVSDGDHLQG